MSKLTDQQKWFCREYIIDLNATQAAKRAGYSEKTAYSQGQRLLKKVEIQTLIAALNETRKKQTGIDAAWVLKSAEKLFNRCMQHEPVLDNLGQPTGEYKFDSSGANKALDTIGKHVDVMAFKERVEHTGKDGGPIIMWGGGGDASGL